jgi:hypothetical protein
MYLLEIEDIQHGRRTEWRFLEGMPRAAHVVAGLAEQPNRRQPEKCASHLACLRTKQGTRPPVNSRKLASTQVTLHVLAPSSTAAEPKFAPRVPARDD